MDIVKDFFYVSDHEGFLKLTNETWKNKWFPNQISLTGDVAHITDLSEHDKEFYQFLFTFLALAEKLVNFNITELLSEFSCHDMIHYYDEQMAMENIHGKVYANILNLFFQNDKASMLLFAEKVVNDDALKQKLDWLHTRVANAQGRAEKVILFLLIEGIFFISSFYCIGLLRVRGIMHGVCLANDYISRDEFLHTRAAALLYNSLIPSGEKLSREWIFKLFTEAVEIEDKFIKATSQGASLVNCDDIKQFLKATADRILLSIGCSKIYGAVPPTSCPLTYTGCVKRVNFFEHETSDYSTVVENDL